jgi:acetylornithine deacetylase/succinyl-diaminopimelate desuccinylase-like protein
VLAKLADQPETFELTDGPAALLRALGEDPSDLPAAMQRLDDDEPALRTLIEPMFGVTLTPTMASASAKMNVIPSRAQVRIDCRVPPGLGEEAARRRIAAVLGPETDELRIEFTERTVGNQSTIESDLMSAIERWVAANDPGAIAAPVILPGFSDSRWFRDAFPDCVAYGFFPMRHQGMLDSGPLIHNADERIDVRDLAFATSFFIDIARELLG